MDYAELAANLCAAGHRFEADEGVTVAGIADILRIPKRRVCILLRRAIEAGAWRLSGKRPYVRIDGTRGFVPVYMPVAQAKGRRKE